jgi:serine O-acetyltransferase
MFDLLSRDLQRYYELDSDTPNPGWLKKLLIVLKTPGIHATVAYRFGSWINRTVHIRLFRYPLHVLYLVLDTLCIILWGIHIHIGAQIGGGLYIGHFSGILIGPAKIGVDCNIAHHVTIGRRADGIGELPEIGDRVWIGVGAVIFGNAKIGDGATIGPNTVVSRRVPPGALVMGNPMKLLRRGYNNTKAIYGKEDQ